MHRRKKQPCAEWPNCQCPKCEAYRDRNYIQTTVGVIHVKDASGPNKIAMKKLPCHYCGEALATTRDHKTPKSKGGRETVPACYECNKVKADLSYEDFMAIVRCGYLKYLKRYGRHWLRGINFRELREKAEAQNR